MGYEARHHMRRYGRSRKLPLLSKRLPTETSVTIGGSSALTKKSVSDGRTTLTVLPQNDLAVHVAPVVRQRTFQAKTRRQKNIGRSGETNVLAAEQCSKRGPKIETVTGFLAVETGNDNARGGHYIENAPMPLAK